ncbi:MAG: SnoaL-like domain-containing protein [Tepidisphaeraceae bacterium]
MSVQTVAGKFMELCKQGKHFEVMRTMYAPEMVSVEGDGKETVGKEAVINKSEVFQGNNAITGQDLRGPFFCGDANAKSGRFAVYTSIDFTPKAGGARVTHDEVGLYTVKNDTITREEFFYDGPFI